MISIFALSLLISSIPHASLTCRGDVVVLLPLLPFGLTANRARQAEERVRSTLAALPGTCLLPRKDTLEALKSQSPCDDGACRVALAQKMGAHILVDGTAFGLGGQTRLTLASARLEGTHSTRVTFPLEETEAATKSLFLARPQPLPLKRSLARVAVGTGLGVLSAAALTSGIVYGLNSRATGQKVATGGVCDSSSSYPACLSSQIVDGRHQAQAANYLYGAAGLLALSCGVTLTWEGP